MRVDGGVGRVGMVFGGDKVSIDPVLGDKRLLGLEPCLFRVGWGM